MPKNLCDKVSKIKNLRWQFRRIFHWLRHGVLHFFCRPCFLREICKTKWTMCRQLNASSPNNEKLQIYCRLENCDLRFLKQIFCLDGSSKAKIKYHEFSMYCFEKVPQACLRCLRLFSCVIYCRKFYDKATVLYPANFPLNNPNDLVYYTLKGFSHQKIIYLVTYGQNNHKQDQGWKCSAWKDWQKTYLLT